MNDFEFMIDGVTYYAVFEGQHYDMLTYDITDDDGNVITTLHFSGDVGVESAVAEWVSEEAYFYIE